MNAFQIHFKKKLIPDFRGGFGTLANDHSWDKSVADNAWPSTPIPSTKLKPFQCSSGPIHSNMKSSFLWHFLEFCPANTAYLLIITFCSFSYLLSFHEVMIRVVTNAYFLTWNALIFIDFGYDWYYYARFVEIYIRKKKRYLKTPNQRLRLYTI